MKVGLVADQVTHRIATATDPRSQPWGSAEASVLASQETATMKSESRKCPGNMARHCLVVDRTVEKSAIGLGRTGEIQEQILDQVKARSPGSSKRGSKARLGT